MPNEELDNKEELSKDDILDILNEDDDKVKDDDKKKDDEEEKEKEDSEEDDKEDDLEDDDEEEIDEDLELAVPVRKKEILKAYPDLFKKFPYLEAAS